VHVCAPAPWPGCMSEVPGATEKTPDRVDCDQPTHKPSIHTVHTTCSSNNAAPWPGLPPTPTSGPTSTPAWARASSRPAATSAGGRTREHGLALRGRSGLEGSPRPCLACRVHALSCPLRPPPWRGGLLLTDRHGAALRGFCGHCFAARARRIAAVVSRMADGVSLRLPLLLTLRARWATFHNLDARLISILLPTVSIWVARRTQGRGVARGRAAPSGRLWNVRVA
jgi:hypothetical protein